MACYLCLKDKELRNSHVIPEFVYKELYGSKHKFHVLSTLKNRPRPMEQKGIREKLLCNECEGKLLLWEKYAREILLGGAGVTVQRDGELLILSGLDYDKFKLFQLSILWRASVSTHPMFSKVNLGPHEERIRKFVDSKNPGRYTDYPCVIFGLTSESGIHGNFIDQPRGVTIRSYELFGQMISKTSHSDGAMNWVPRPFYVGNALNWAKRQVRQAK